MKKIKEKNQRNSKKVKRYKKQSKSKHKIKDKGNIYE